MLKKLFYWLFKDVLGVSPCYYGGGYGLCRNRDKLTCSGGALGCKFNV